MKLVNCLFSFLLKFSKSGDFTSYFFTCLLKGGIKIYQKVDKMIKFSSYIYVRKYKN